MLDIIGVLFVCSVLAIVYFVVLSTTEVAKVAEQRYAIAARDRDAIGEERAVWLLIVSQWLFPMLALIATTVAIIVVWENWEINGEWHYGVIIVHTLLSLISLTYIRHYTVRRGEFTPSARYGDGLDISRCP